VAGSLADDLMSFYHGHEPGGTPGLLPDPYYWWEAGALMGALVDYWHYTGDGKWNDVAAQALLFQVGPNNDYMPTNQTRTEGNDDQGFWGMAAMSAAEYKFPDPPHDSPQWLALAQAVFNTQAARWDTHDCGGGLRWQIFTWNKGYDYKNSISQACFFNIAARLARYTGNSSYADWASKTWDWMENTNLLQEGTYYVFDGTHIKNCSEHMPYQWTYNAGAFLLGAAAMYNFSVGTPAEGQWRQRFEGLFNGTQVFFTGPDKNIMTEVACEPVNLCNVDQQSFKAYLARWMAASIKWVPWIAGRAQALLSPSAEAAVSTCRGGDSGRLCGLKWTEHGKWDGTSGVGQQMAALQIVMSGLVDMAPGPVTQRHGSSRGDPGAGGSDVGRTDPFDLDYGREPATLAAKAGAALLTLLTLAGLVAGCLFVATDMGEGRDIIIPGDQTSETRRPDSIKDDDAAAAAAAVVVQTLEHVAVRDGCGFVGGRPKPRRPKTDGALSDASSSSSSSSVMGGIYQQPLPYTTDMGEELSSLALRKKAAQQSRGRPVQLEAK